MKKVLYGKGNLISMPELMSRAPGFFCYSQKQVEESSLVAGSAYISKLLGEGYFIFPGPPKPTNLVELKQSFGKHFDVPGESWYDKLCFATREKLSPLGYMALRPEVVANSLNETWENGVDYLKYKVETVPLAVEVVYAAVLYRLVRNKILSTKITLRTASVVSTTDGEAAHVGIYYSPERGISILSTRNHVRDKLIGTAAKRIIEVVRA